MSDIYKWFLETASQKLVVRILLSPYDEKSKPELDIFIYLTNSPWVTINGIYDKYHFKARNYEKICLIPEMVEYTDLRAGAENDSAVAESIQAELNKWDEILGWDERDQFVITDPPSLHSMARTSVFPSLTIRMHLVEIHYWVVSELQKIGHGGDLNISMSFLKNRLQGLINDHLNEYTKTIDILEKLVESEVL